MPGGEAFIDIHSHLLPGVDDGAEDMAMSMQLIEQGMEDGIGTWVATPHVIDQFTAEIDAHHRAVFDELRAEVERRGYGVELHLASEIMFQEDVQSVRARPSGTFDEGGRYFLMEFPLSFFPGHAEDILFDFQRARMTPIIAHVERYASLMQQPEKVAQMVDRGILMQMNARSILSVSPPNLRRFAERLVTGGAIHFVASDAHHPRNRPAQVREAYDRVAELAGEDTANRLFIENPRRVIDGERIETVRPELPDRTPWWERLVMRLAQRSTGG